MQHPEDWPHVVGKRIGTLKLTRRFHAPTNLDADEEVFVVLSGVFGAGDVTLNGQPLGAFDLTETTWEFRLPHDLPRFNELAVVLTWPERTSESHPTGLYDVVLLEIRRTGNAQKPGKSTPGF